MVLRPRRGKDASTPRRISRSVRPRRKLLARARQVSEEEDIPASAKQKRAWHSIRDPRKPALHRAGGVLGGVSLLSRPVILSSRTCSGVVEGSLAILSPSVR